MGLEDFDVKIKYGNSLELETDNETVSNSKDTSTSTDQQESLNDIIRDGFRAPVGASDNVCLVINDRTYKVFNLSASGIGIFLEDTDKIEPQAIVKDMILHINDKEFRIDGQIIHISQDEAQYLCGIHIITMDDSCRGELVDYLEKSRNTLFT